MSYRTCEACGQGFEQFGRGRPAKRCHDCREHDRYGPIHQQLRANPEQAVGTACTRCGRMILDGQEVSPDHVDGGGPHDYRGWAHRHCNVSAGAAYGNRLRAQAYRQARGMAPAAQPSSNGAAVAVAEPLPARSDPRHECEPAGCHPQPGGPCNCGRHSRAW